VEAENDIIPKRQKPQVAKPEADEPKSFIDMLGGLLGGGTSLMDFLGGLLKGGKADANTSADVQNKGYAVPPMWDGEAVAGNEKTGPSIVRSYAVNTGFSPELREALANRTYTGDESSVLPAGVTVADSTPEQQIKMRLNRYAPNGAEIDLVEINGKQYVKIQGGIETQATPLGGDISYENNSKSSLKMNFGGASYDGKSKLERAAEKLGVEITTVGDPTLEKYKGKKIGAAELQKMSQSDLDKLENTHDHGVLIPADQFIKNGKVDDGKLNGFINGYSQMVYGKNYKAVSDNYSGMTSTDVYTDKDKVGATYKARDALAQKLGVPVDIQIDNDGRTKLVAHFNSPEQANRVAGAMNQAMQNNDFLDAPKSKAKGSDVSIDAAAAVQEQNGAYIPRSPRIDVMSKAGKTASLVPDGLNIGTQDKSYNGKTVTAPQLVPAAAKETGINGHKL
jgi:hypothetical protein